MKFLETNDIIELDSRYKFIQELPNSIYQTLKYLGIRSIDFIDLKKF